MRLKLYWAGKGFLLILLLIGTISLQNAIVPQFYQSNPAMINGNLVLGGNDEITLNGPITVSDGEILEYTNKTIYYDSSETPMFTVYGTLKLINCKITPLKDPVDFISANYGKVILENVTFINPSGGDNAIFSISRSTLYVNNATFSGFYGGDISESDAYISNMYANVTRQFGVYASNFTIINSRINLVGNNQVRLLEITFSDNVTLINNTFKIPVEAVEEYSAWLEAISLSGDKNMVVRGNTVINGGKTLVSYGSSNVLIVNNTFKNEKLVEGTELQIDADSKDIMIVNNSFYRLWEAIEIYAHENITIVGNFIAQSLLGIKVEPGISPEVTDVHVYGNILSNSSLFIYNSNDLTVENNTIENGEIYMENCSNVTFIRNILRNASIDVTDSKDIKIVNNTIYVFEGEWLNVDENSTVIEEGNTIIPPLSSGGEESNEENQGTSELQDESMQIPIHFGMIIGIIAIGLATVLLLKRRKKNLAENLS